MREAPFLDFPMSEYRDRVNRVRNLMQANSIDGLFLTMKENLEYITGFQDIAITYPFKQFGLIFPIADEPSLVLDILHKPNAELTSWVDNIRAWGQGASSHVEVIVDSLRNAELSNKTVGMELGPSMRLNMAQLDYDSLKRELPNMRIVDAGDLLRAARMVKSELELERIRKACNITCRGFVSILLFVCF